MAKVEEVEKTGRQGAENQTQRRQTWHFWPLSSPVATHFSSTASVAGLHWVRHCSLKPLIDTRTESHGHKDSMHSLAAGALGRQLLYGTCHSALAPSTKFSSSPCSCCGKKSPRPAGAKQGSWKQGIPVAQPQDCILEATSLFKLSWAESAGVGALGCTV